LNEYSLVLLTGKNISPYFIFFHIQQYKSHYRSVIRRARLDCFENKFDEHSNNMKQTWNTIEEVDSKKPQELIPSLFLHNGKVFNG